MKKGWPSEEQIVGILKQHEAGARLVDLRREYGISAVTLHAWRHKFGGMNVSEALQLTAMEDELRRLKVLVAQAEVARRGTKTSRRLVRQALRSEPQEEFAMLALQKLQALRLRRSGV
jgi:putative transposase